MKMPLLSIEERKTTFKEVELGFTHEQALTEAMRCLQCPAPKCVEGCPARVNIPGFIKELRQGKIDESAQVIRQSNFFPSICGRICQHERQCEGACILAKTGDPIQIGGIERFVGDHASFPTPSKKLIGKKAAIIGSGPSGLTVAAYLALSGVSVTVYEGTNALGGVIKYGVPDFRLPKEAIGKELEHMHKLEIDFEPNSKKGEESLEELSKQFDAIFVGTGVGRSKKPNIPGIDLKNVISAMKFLVNLNQSDFSMISNGGKVAVVGAGYVGIDASRAAIRMGADVTCLTVASRESAYKSVAEKDYKEAEEEGVKFMFSVKVDRLEGKDKVDTVHYSNGFEGKISVDTVIYAVGQEHDDDDSLRNTLRTKEDGCIKIAPNYQTVIPNVFAGGDCVHGPKTVIHAVATGREAAKAMVEYMLKPENERKSSEKDAVKNNKIGLNIINNTDI
ncbi:MAG: FAD-dependent oxidoreductase [archaeon]